MINTAAFSYASQAYPDNVEVMISLMETVVGLGSTVSPMLGLYIYHVVGFSNTFFIYGLTMAPCTLFILCLTDPVIYRESTATQSTLMSRVDNSHRRGEGQEDRDVVYDLVSTLKNGNKNSNRKKEGVLG